jgi:hypothetical protein
MPKTVRAPAACSQIIRLMLGQKMHEIIPKLKTLEECLQLIKNVAERNPALAREVRRRLVELRAIAHGSKNEVERELLYALYAYEEVLSQKNKKRTRAQRTWNMIKDYGIIGAAEKAVDRKIEPAGYKILVDIGMQDWTFEAVIIRYPDYFKPDVVRRAKTRLDSLKTGDHLCEYGFSKNFSNDN